MPERTSVSLRERDNVRIGLTVTARTGTDMAETANGWLFRCYRQAANVVVERTRDAGKTWESITVGESLFANPTLAVDRWDHVWCWFNDLTTSYGYLSKDYGESWTLFASHPGGGPRMSVLVEDAYLVLHDGLGTATVYRTTDGGVTLSPVFGQTCPAQVVSLESDRFGILHLVYKDSADRIWHKHATDPATGNFGTPVFWTAGRFPTYAIGIEWGLAVWFNGGSMFVSRTDETQSNLTGSVVVPSGAYTAGYTGVIVDRRGQAWLTPKPAGQPVTSIWSGANLVGWSNP